MEKSTRMAGCGILVSPSSRKRIELRSLTRKVFGRMLIELITLFAPPVVYCGYMEFKWNSGLPDKRFDRSVNQPDAEPMFVD